MRDIKSRKVHPHCRRATKYAKDIVSGKIPACRWTILACQRFLNDLEAKVWRLNRNRAERFCDFCELMPHVKGKWAGTLLKLEPWQAFIIVNLFGWEDPKTGLRRFRRAFVFVPRKNGKGLALDTPLPTPDGWTTMGDVQLGDSLYAEDGTECRVTFVSDHRRLDCYEIEFSNGERIVCDGDHLWETVAKVDTPGSAAVYPRVKKPLKAVRDTRKLFETQTYGVRGDRNHSIDMPSPICGEHVDLPIDPYLLGVWLGDGNSLCSKISSGDEDIDFMMSELRKFEFPVRASRQRTCWEIKLSNPSGTRWGKTLRHKLQKLGVLGNKHLPREYLRSSLQQRIALLQGLMDTDGTCDSRGRGQEFSTTKKIIAEGFCELLASLGIKHRVREKSMRCNGRDVDGTNYRIQFCMHRDVLPVFRMPRKLSRQTLTSSKSCAPRSRTVQISAIRRVETVTTKCIQVDSKKSLFLCGKTMLPTHNTASAVPIALGMLTVEAEPGAEVYCGAMNEDQANEVFRPAKAMAKRAKGFAQHFGVEVAASSIFREEGLSFFKRLIGKPGDGQSPYCAIHDEYHQHKDSSQVDAMDTGMGARQEPLQLIITTAGTDSAGPCKDFYDYSTKVLEGQFENDQLFALIYGIDPEDDWTEWSSWVKANPNLGVSVSEEYLRGKLKEAIQRTSMQNTVKTKHLNVWCNVGTAWINMAKWNANTDESLEIENFAGCQAWVGIDLASKIDLVAMMILIKYEGQFFLFGKYYLPEETVNLEENKHYQTWVLDGHITETPGARTDFWYLERDLCGHHPDHEDWREGDEEVQGLYDILEVVEVVYDPREATYVMPAIQAKISCPVVEMTQSAASLSEPMKEFEGAYISGNLFHSGDPVLSWAASNVMLKESRNKLYYPAKASAGNKIDPIVASIMCMARAMAESDDGFAELVDVTKYIGGEK